MVSIVLRLYCLFVLVTPLMAGDLSRPIEKRSLQNTLTGLYHFKFNEADSIISELEKNYPDEYIPAVARANYLWWYMISQSADAKIRSEYTKNLLHAEQLVTEAFSGLPANDELFFLIHIYAYRLRLELMHGEYLQAYRYLRQAMRHISLSLGKEDEHPAFLLTSGLYNYMTEHIRKNYPLFRIYLLMHPRGDMSLGIKQLQMASIQNDQVLQTEAHYFLMRIYLDLEDRPDIALGYASRLTEMYPENLIYLYYHRQIASELELKDLVVRLENQFFEALDRNQQLTPDQKHYMKSLPGP
jgi:tetratricopeptide (TPR) repeat protein